MHRLTALAGALVIAAILPAQSPLTTQFASNNSGSAGGTVLFDLTVNVGVTITQIDVNTVTAALTPGTLEIRTAPLSYIGNEFTPAAWTSVSAGNALTTAANNTPTVCALTTPVTLTPGTYGIMLKADTWQHAYTNGAVPSPGNIFSSAELTIGAGAAQNVEYVGAFTPRVANISLHYTVGSGFASATSYGTGCNFRPASFYETFAAGTIDLGTAAAGNVNVIQLIPTGTGYFIVPGASGPVSAANWFTPTSPNLGLPDDGVTGQLPLPFTFNYTGGSTNSVIVESNGNVWLQPPSHTSFICNTAPGALLTRGPVISAFYDDMDPSATGGGTVHFDVPAGNQVAYCTWDQVPGWITAPPSPRPTSTLQVALFSNGMIELRYQVVDSTVSWTRTLVGFSPGAGNLDPGNRDISATMPFFTGNDTPALALAAQGRPIIGNAAFALNIIDMPATSLAGALLLSLTQINPGAPLAGLGMPDCFQYVGASVTRIVVFLANPTPVGVAIPNNPSLAGLLVYGQAAAFDAAANTLGILASNGVALVLNPL